MIRFITYGMFLAVGMIAAIIGIVIWFASVPEVNAQTSMQITQMRCTADLNPPSPAIEANGGAIIELDRTETSAYVAATSRGMRHVRDVSARLAVFASGEVAMILPADGKSCGFNFVNPNLHRQTMLSLRGQPL